METHKITTTRPVGIVGAGLAGLACGVKLKQAGLPVRLFEAAEEVGGRVRTDRVDGFLLDHGFQVLLTAYPAARELLDYKQLDLRTFEPGAEIWTGKRFERVSDPFRRPGDLWKTVLARVGTISDKLRIGQLRLDVSRGTNADLFARPEQPTAAALANYGFSEELIQKFFRPFFGGIFLESGLSTSSRMMQFVFKMFSQGDAALPADGMAAIPQQLARRIGASAISLQTRVTSFEQGRLRTESGETVDCSAVVLAVEQPALARLIPEWPNQPSYPATKCLYFSAPAAPIDRKVLMLNGTGGGLVNNVVVPSLLSAKYAPEGQSLISVSIVQETSSLEAEKLVGRIRDELAGWFGPEVQDWRHLATYDIPFALPNQATVPIPRPEKVTLPPGVFVAGDHTLHGSQQGALESGLKAADAVIAALAEQTATR